MKAMILAAGRGERMRPLTDKHPKPLLKAGHCTLIEHHIVSLQKAGIRELVINTGWLGEQLPSALGNGSQLGVAIEYSHEGHPALETAGGIIKALPLFAGSDFIVVNGDIYTDFDYSSLALKEEFDAHIVLTANPPHNLNGDFSLEGYCVIPAIHEKTVTYSGIAVFNERFFKGETVGRLALKPMLDRAIEQRRLSGEVFQGKWIDIGTAERLDALNNALTNEAN